MIYTAAPGPYFAAHFPGSGIGTTRIRFVLGEGGFEVDGRWEDYETGENQPTSEQVAAWTPPAPDPGPTLTDVERLAQGVTLYRAANEAAKEIILALMVKVGGALINFELFTSENVNDEGTRFVTFHRNAIVDFKQAGRNQLAAQALYDAINSEESRTAFTWLEVNGGIILGIFAADLGAS